MGREDGELDSFGGHHVQHAAVDGGLGQPHAFGPAAEAVLEVGDAPADLRDGVAPAGQRQDDVVVDLRDAPSRGRRSAARWLRSASRMRAIGARSLVGHPLQQGGAEVEAHARVVVHDAHDLVLAVGDARGAVGRVTLRGDALVPVVIGRGGVLHLDRLQPGVLARRLVEVAMHADVPLGCGRRRRLVSRPSASLETSPWNYRRLRRRVHSRRRILRGADM